MGARLGRERGYGLMIGGEAEVARRLEPAFRTLASGRGAVERTSGRVALAGPAAQGYEGSAGSRARPEDLRYDRDLREIAEVWRRGGAGSWRLDPTAQALAENPTRSAFTGTVQDSGEERWTSMAAIEESVLADVLAASLSVRFRSQREHTVAENVRSAMRQKFDGHVERPAGG